MMKACLFILLIYFPAFGVREFYSLTRSIRSLGMGGAFYGLSDDEYAAFYNPAGLSLYRGDGQLMLGIQGQVSDKALSATNGLFSSTGSSKNVSNVINELKRYQGIPVYLNAGLLPFFVNRSFSVGFLIADTKLNFALLGKEFDSSVDIAGISDSGLVFGYGRPLLRDTFHVGFSTKLIYRAGGKKTFSLLDMAKDSKFVVNPQDLGGAGAGIDFDVGFMYEPHFPFGIHHRFSLVFGNLLASKFEISRVGGRPPQNPRMLSLGAMTVLNGWRFIDNFILLLDIAEFSLGGESDPDYGARSGRLWKHINFGIELPMNGWFFVRTGFHQGYFTAGLGISIKFLKLDLATYEEDLAQDVNRISARRFAVRLAIGSGSSSPPPYGYKPDIPPRPIVRTKPRQESEKLNEQIPPGELESLETKPDPSGE